jgi:phosphatase NudJ
MSRPPIPTWFFTLSVVRLGSRFLIVREARHGNLWYLPAGRAEPGETFIQAAQRQTFEEAGIRVAFDGIIRVEHTPMPEGSRLRMVLAAHPIDDTPLKRAPDQHSLGAAWVTVPELDGLALRGPEVRTFFSYVNAGGLIVPLSLLGSEA